MYLSRRTFMQGASAATAATILKPPRLLAQAFSLNAKDAPFNAVGDFIHDDTAAIQAAIDTAAANGFGGCAVLLPPGKYFAHGIVNKRGVTLDGPGRTTSLIDCKGVEEDVLTFDASCNYAAARNLSVYGNAGHNTVKIAENAPVNLINCNIFEGYNALFNAGCDGLVDNCFISTPRNANVVSVGSNWWRRVKLDVAGAIAPKYAFDQSQSFAGNVECENSFDQVDMTGDWREAAMMVNDLGTHKTSMWFTGSNIGGSIVLKSAAWLGLTGCKLGPDHFNQDPSCAVDVTGCFTYGRICTVHGPNVKITGGHNVVAA